MITKEEKRLKNCHLKSLEILQFQIVFCSKENVSLFFDNSKSAVLVFSLTGF